MYPFTLTPITVITIFNLHIWTTQLHTILGLNFEKVQFSTINYLLLCLKVAGCMANSVDPGETPHSAVSHLGLPVCSGMSALINMVNMESLVS